MWVLREPGGKVAVVDPSEAKPVVAALEQLGVTPDYILNTHHHWDHTGWGAVLSAAAQSPGMKTYLGITNRENASCAHMLLYVTCASDFAARAPLPMPLLQWQRGAEAQVRADDRGAQGGSRPHPGHRRGAGRGRHLGLWPAADARWSAFSARNRCIAVRQCAYGTQWRTSGSTTVALAPASGSAYAATFKKRSAYSREHGTRVSCCRATDLLGSFAQCLIRRDTRVGTSRCPFHRPVQSSQVGYLR